MSNKFHTLTIKDVVKETPETISVIFNIPDSLKGEFYFQAGQYLTLKADIKGQDVRRSYSLSSAPYENEWRVGIKKIDNGLFSSYAQNLKAGDKIEVMPPEGNFTVKNQNASTYLFFAAGSGITPIISLIKDLLQNKPSANVILMYSNKTPGDVVYGSEIEHLKAKFPSFTVHYFYSQQKANSDVLTGRINQEKLNSIYNNLLNGVQIDEIYSCGPQEMIFAIESFFLGKNITKSNIHYELFTATAPTADKKAEVSKDVPNIMSNVTVIVDDEEFTFNLSSKGKNILQAAQDEDADVPYSCKGGVCCTCKAKIIEGKVIMDLNYALDPEEVEDGFILTCQAHPTTEKVIISFDEY